MPKNEKKELEILDEFLPDNLSSDEIEDLVEEGISNTKATDINDMGRVMGHVMGKAKGRADGNEVRKVVEEKLQK